MHRRCYALALLIVFMSNYRSKQLMELSNDLFSPFKYKDLPLLAEELKDFNELVRVRDLHEIYPDVVKPDCGDLKCHNFLFEVHDFGEKYKNMSFYQTILVVAGINGTDHVGINSMFHFLRTIPHLFKTNENWYKILQNIRLLILPLANPSAFIREDRFEIVKQADGSSTPVDPAFDFNWKNKDKCFQSSTANYLYNIQEEYLIMATLILSSGKSQILYPNMPDSGNKSTAPEDSKMYSTIADLLTLTANNDINHGKGIFERLSVDNFSASKNYYESDQVGSYAMWSYAASTYLDDLNTKCFESNEVFKKNYVPPTEISHRSLTFQIDLKDEQNLKREQLGNQMALMLPKNKLAEAGLVSQTVNILQQFSEIIRPYMKISRIVLENDNELVVKFRIKGCKKVNEFQITEPKGLEFTFENTLEKIETVTFVLKYNLILDLKEFQEKFDPTKNVLRFNFLCDDQFYSESSEHDQNHTLFGDLKKERGASGRRQRQSIPTSHFFYSEILNFDISKLANNKSLLDSTEIDNLFSYQSISFNQIAIHSQLVLALQMGPYFPVLFYYNKKSRRMDIDLKKENLPALSTLDAKVQDTTSLLEYGIGNTLEEMQQSYSLKLAIRTIEEYWDSVTLNILRPKHNLATPKVEKSEPELLLRRQESSFEIQSYDFHTDSFTPKEGVFMNIDWFIRHIGDLAYFKMDIGIGKVFDHDAKLSTDLEKVNNIINNNQLSGKLVIYDEAIIARDEKQNAVGLIDNEDYFKLRPTPGIEPTFKPMFCTSISTTLLNDTVNGKKENIELEVTQEVKKYIRKSQNFYGIKVFRNPNRPTKGMINLYVSANALEPFFVFRYKSKVFKLTSIGKTLPTKVEVDGKMSELSIYAYVGEVEEFFFGGRLNALYDPEETKELLDCFLQWESESLDFAEQYQQQMDAVNKAIKDLNIDENDLKLIDLKDFKGLKNSRDSRLLSAGIFEIWIFMVVSLLLV